MGETVELLMVFHIVRLNEKEKKKAMSQRAWPRLGLHFSQWVSLFSSRPQTLWFTMLGCTSLKTGEGVEEIYSMSEWNRVCVCVCNYLATLCLFFAIQKKKKKKHLGERENRKEVMQYLGCGVTYIEPSLEFPTAFPRCAASNWELGDTDTGLTLLPVNKDNQALIDLQVL